MVRASRAGHVIVEMPGAYIRRGDKTSTVSGVRDSFRYFGKLLAFRRALRSSDAVKALDEIGGRKAVRFLFFTLALLPYRLALLPPLRALWLRLLGARIGRRVVLHDVRFFNAYRRGFGGLAIGDECFLGDECLFDLAEGIVLESQVTLAERVLVLTHMNVGYHDHPLQSRFPPMAAPVLIERGSFVGANVTILAGVKIGAGSFVAAGSVVTEDVAPKTLVAGVPARRIRSLD